MDNKLNTNLFLCIFSFARSGTNFLSDIFGSLDNVYSFREIYQPHGCHFYNSNTSKEERNIILNILRQELKTDFKGPRDPQLINMLHDRPCVFFDALNNSKKLKSPRVVTLKIFANHLSEDLITNNIMMRKDVCNIFYYRNPLDTFISAMKTKAVKSSINVNTTEIKPTLDINEYIKFRKIRANFFKYIDNYSKKFLGYFTYEDFTNLNDDAHRIAAIKRIVGELNIDSTSKTSAIQTTIKQDQSSKPEYKVTNFFSFINECEDNGFNPWIDDFNFNSSVFLNNLIHKD